MNNVKLKDIMQFNPPESVKNGVDAKKIPMEKLLPHKRISGFEKVNHLSCFYGKKQEKISIFVVEYSKFK